MTENSIPYICTKCGKEFPRTSEYFVRAKRNSDGLMTYCKECRNQKKRLYNADNRTKVRTQKRAAHLRTKDKDNARSREWHHAHREELSQRRKQQNLDNPAPNRKRAKQWYAENKERGKARARAYYRNNTERVKRYVKEYNAKNIKASRAWGKASVARRRARMRGVDGNYTRQDVERIYEEQDHRCAYCGITLYMEIAYDVHVDHIVPIVRGGSNSPDNLAITCQACNLSKSDKLYEEWIAVRGW